MKIFCCVLGVIFLSILSCDNQKNKQERLAKQYCGSCHAFPQPNLLDKNTWEKQVLPDMAFRMGLDNSPLNTINLDDQAAILRSLPRRPMISHENWEVIKSFYVNNAPDTLASPPQIVTDTLRRFEAEPKFLSIAQPQTVTSIKYDSAQGKIYVGNRPGKLYIFNREFMAEDSFQLHSSPSKFKIDLQGSILMLLMGIMDPNEQENGRIAQLQENGTVVDLIDSLQRPVDFETSDLDNDGAIDYVVCNFGNYTGSLIAYQSLPGGMFNKHVLQPLPGARRIIIKDIDRNGMPDILALMTQGDERIIAFYNQGNFQFRMSTLLRFDAVYGSSYFDISDFNNDGKFDILYTNGDNADYSPVLKPYHGIRIFLNTGTNDFKEHWFYAMHGASQARIADFDKDGDQDIAAISFFPDFIHHADQAFIYFENTPEGFMPQKTTMARKGRWITMEMADVDNDGDSDLLLGSMTFPTLVPADLTAEWKNDKISILLLRNNLN